MRILAYCVMPNHWHLVLWPARDGDLARFMTWLTLTHTQRWHARRGSIVIDLDTLEGEGLPLAGAPSPDPRPPVA